MLTRALLVAMVVGTPAAAFALDVNTVPIPWPGFGTAFLLAAGVGAWALVRGRRRRK